MAQDEKDEIEEIIGGDVAKALRFLAGCIYPTGVAPGLDAVGTTVESVTEAIMGVTGGLVRIAEALDNIADAINGSPAAERAADIIAEALRWGKSRG